MTWGWFVGRSTVPALISKPQVIHANTLLSAGAIDWMALHWPQRDIASMPSVATPLLPMSTSIECSNSGVNLIFMMVDEFFEYSVTNDHNAKF